jgi:hypothetical protein
MYSSLAKCKNITLVTIIRWENIKLRLTIEELAASHVYFKTIY